MSEMKYLMLFEAFEANALSKMMAFLAKKTDSNSKEKFRDKLKTLITQLDIPIDKIKDSDIKYLNRNQALKLKSEKESDSIYCLKFWFSMDEGFLGFTGTSNVTMDFNEYISGSRRRRNSSSDKNSPFTNRELDYIKNRLDIKEGSLEPVKNYENIRHGQLVIGIFSDDEDSLERLGVAKIWRDENQLYAIQDVTSGGSPDNEIKRYVFTTFHQSYSYEDFIEGIKPIMIDGEVDGNVAYHIEDGVFKQLCKKAEMDKENRYAIFIDEINRGNVSAIFGELITLIEQDKRKDASNAMSALLPYSKKQFSVPQNVDIYGTMNTADRSVEALDTALRRRFSFEEMLPKPELLKDKGENGSGKVGEINLEELLKTINERIEALVDRDHTIGHAFFMEVDSLDSLRNVFANKVIPLLQEYFYGDYAKMEMVIGPDFFNIKESSKIKFAVKPEDFESTGKTYHIKNLSDKIIMSDDMLLEAFYKLITGVA